MRTGGNGVSLTIQITAAPPLNWNLAGNQRARHTFDSTTSLSTPSSDADDLTSHNVPDLLANEQTWPTEEEMAGAPGSEARSAPRRVKRVPKGTSAYQAAWIFDDDDDEVDGDDSDDQHIDEEDDLGSDMGDDEGRDPGTFIRSLFYFAAYSLRHG